MSLPDAHWVFDTNVIVSAMLFSASVPGRAFHAALSLGEILLSEATVVELTEVLGREKFDRYLTAEEREHFLSRLIEKGIIVDITEEIRQCRDPKDDKFLEVAVNGHASWLVTGDADLLVLNPFRGILILTPSQFIELLTK